MSRIRSTELFCETNVRPSNYKSHREGGTNNGGDCTTRAMCYCLNGKMDYDSIEKEQYRLGAERGTRRNVSGTWDIIMKREGYRWLFLTNGKHSRANIAIMLKSISTPMITHSRGHVAVVHNGLVKDTWNSTSGLVDNIMVAEADFEKVRMLLDLVGVETEEVDKPKVIVKHHRRIVVGGIRGILANLPKYS